MTKNKYTNKIKDWFFENPYSSGSFKSNIHSAERFDRVKSVRMEIYLHRLMMCMVFLLVPVGIIACLFSYIIFLGFLAFTIGTMIAWGVYFHLAFKDTLRYVEEHSLKIDRKIFEKAYGSKKQSQPKEKEKEK